MIDGFSTIFPDNKQKIEKFENILMSNFLRLTVRIKLTFLICPTSFPVHQPYNSKFNHKNLALTLLSRTSHSHCKCEWWMLLLFPLNPLTNLYSISGHTHKKILLNSFWNRKPMFEAFIRVSDINHRINPYT